MAVELALPVALHQLAEPEQLVNDVNPVTPPPKKKPTVEQVDLLTPSSSSTHTYISSKSASPAHDAP